jgi:serine/threonine-protein kinase RsbW
MTSNKISFKIENKLPELNGLCRQVEAFAKKHQLSPKDVFEIHLCLEEHITNIISHGYTDSKTHLIEITLSVENEKFVVCIEDDGIAFNPTKIAAPDFQCPLEERKIGGLGVYLTKHFMDNLVYQRSGNKNVLVMTKKIDRQAEDL